MTEAVNSAKRTASRRSYDRKTSIAAIPASVNRRVQRLLDAVSVSTSASAHRQHSLQTRRSCPDLSVASADFNHQCRSDCPTRASGCRLQCRSRRASTTSPPGDLSVVLAAALRFFPRRRGISAALIVTAIAQHRQLPWKVISKRAHQRPAECPIPAPAGCRTAAPPHPPWRHRSAH